jgi:hypothetical protein
LFVVCCTQYAFVHDVAAVALLSSALTQHPLVTHVVLPHCRVTCDGAATLARALPSMHALEVRPI